MYSLQKPVLNIAHTLKEPFANLRAGERIYCFSETDEYYWILLPKPWHGVTEIKVHKDLLLSII